MKKFASIAAVVGLLLAAAIYYSNVKQKTQPEPKPTPDEPVVKTDPNTPTTPKSTDAPKTQAISQGTLTLKSAISHGYLSKGNANDVYATVDINAVKFNGQNRPPLNIALVIDRSGSMAGAKIEHAKNAARRLVNILNAKDRLAIVSYGSDVTVDFGSRMVSADNRAQMLRAIDGISVSGGTNLSGGYERGLSEVGRWKNGKSINRVILMSDGNANIGTTHIPELERMARNGLGSGVSLTSMGVGLDYNEDLMTRMSNQGAGNYYFIDNFQTIASVFEKELKGLKSTVARNAAVVLTLAPGVKLQNLYGFPYRQNGQQIMISLSEFYSEQSKNILLKLSVPGNMDNKRPVLDAQISYTDVVLNKPGMQANKVHAVVTSDAKKIEKSVDASVISRVQQVEVATTMQKAMKLYEDGNTAAATKTIDRVQRNIVTNQARFKSMKDNKAFGRVYKEMDSMKKTIKAKPATSTEGRRLRKAKKARSNYIMFDAASF